MILPTSYLISILLLVAAMLCCGSWANMFKATQKWRYELFCIDFAVGALLAALIAAFTFGSLGWDGFSFIDSVRTAGKRQEMYAFLGGMIFNIGNMLLIGAISLGGISLAFPIGLGVALIVGVIWNCLFNPIVNPVLLGVGCVAVAIAIVLDAICYKSYKMQRLLEAIREGRTKSTKKIISSKAIIVATIAGVLIGSFTPLLSLAREGGEIGLGPYSTTVIFALGIFVSTFLYNLFLMNLPIQGKPVELGDYFKGRGTFHLLGFAGGALFTAGSISSLVASASEGVAQAGVALTYGLTQGAIVVGALWGLMYWKEYAGADSKTRTFLVAMVVLLILGIGVVAVAPVYGKH